MSRKYGNRICNLNLFAECYLILIVLFIFSCKKLEPERILNVHTGTVTNVTYSSCTASGTIIDDQEERIIEYGHCWSENSNPSTNDYKFRLYNKNSTGDYNSNLSGLRASTTYYIRAYAINSKSTAYGKLTSFTTSSAIVPSLSTSPIMNISNDSVTCGGNVSEDGGKTVTARGVCWSTNPNPTIIDTRTNDGSGTGNYNSTLTGLLPDTTYYVRAYATNSAGTGYGNEISFKTNIGVPVMTTTTVSSITDNTAISGGNISNDGGTSILTCGVCWSTSPNPTTEDDKTINSSCVNVFLSDIEGLQECTQYYVRAYATNTSGNGYGNEISFTTKFDWLVIPDQYLSNVIFYKPTIDIPAVVLGNIGDTIYKLKIEKAGFVFEHNNSLNNVFLEKGNIYTYTFSTLKHTGYLIIQSNQIYLGNNFYCDTIIIGDASGNFTDSNIKPIDGSILYFDNQSNPDTSFLEFNLEFYLIHSGNDIKAGEEVNVDIAFTDLNFRAVICNW
jgi:hypothetical protein